MGSRVSRSGLDPTYNPETPKLIPARFSCAYIGFVPPRLAATAQALYGTIGIGIANVLVTLASGWLIARMGYQAFLVMAALCLAALPFTSGLDRRSATGEPARTRSRPT